MEAKAKMEPLSEKNEKERTMVQIVTNGYGYLYVKNIEKETGNGPEKVVSVKTGTDPADLTRWEAFQLIEKVADLSGLGVVVNETSGEITILKPESPAVRKRKDKLSMEFFGVKFDRLDTQSTRNIEYIISLEKKTGELE